MVYTQSSLFIIVFFLVFPLNNQVRATDFPPQQAPAGATNVRDFGATCNGTGDDTASLQAAAAAIPPGGGTLYVPPGLICKLSGTVLLSSNTHVLAYHATFRPTGSGKAHSVFRNRNNSIRYLTTTDRTTDVAFLHVSSTQGATVGQEVLAEGIPLGTTIVSVAASSIKLSVPVSVKNGTLVTLLSDHDISIEGGTIDYTEARAGQGTHAIEMDFVSRVRILRVVGRGAETDGEGAGDFVACIGCSDVLEQENDVSGFSNSDFDHWWGTSNVSIINNKIVEMNTNQIINVNSKETGFDSPGPMSRKFTLTGNDISYKSPKSGAILISPIGKMTSVADVSISNNNFYNSSVLIRGNTQNIDVHENNFSNILGGSSAIGCYADASGTPKEIKIIGNKINNAATAASNLAVIRVEAENATVAKNTVTGGAHYAGIYASSGVALSNNVVAPGIKGYRITGPARPSR